LLRLNLFRIYLLWPPRAAGTRCPLRSDERVLRTRVSRQIQWPVGPQCSPVQRNSLINTLPMYHGR
jgi:hypothetical protein